MNMKEYIKACSQLAHAKGLRFFKYARTCSFYEGSEVKAKFNRTDDAYKWIKEYQANR